MKGKVRRSLRASIYDGILAAAGGSVTDQFIAPFAIALQANAAQIANLASLPGLIGSAAQLQAGFVSNHFHRRRAPMIAGIVVQIGCFFALAAVPWLGGVPAMVSLMVVYTAAGCLSAPLWAGLMCEYLPLSHRSGYFGWRNRFLGVITMLATGAGGLVLHHFGRLNWHGFVWILVAAGCLRLMSLKFLRQMHEPAEIAQEAPSYRACLMRHPHYSRFIMTYGLMAICVSLTSPFLSLFMLRDLGWSYAQYTLMIVAAQATLYWMMGRWGRNADSAGNMKIIQITARFLPLTALLWIFSRNFYYLMGVQLVSGAVWAGYNLCVGNYVYDAVPNRQRVHATALFSTVNGLATFVGATLGGFLLNLLPPLGGERYYSLLLAGGLARMLVGWLLFPRLREVREVAPTRSKELVCDVLGIDSLRDAVPFEI